MLVGGIDLYINIRAQHLTLGLSLTPCVARNFQCPENSKALTLRLRGDIEERDNCD